MRNKTCHCDPVCHGGCHTKYGCGCAGNASRPDSIRFSKRPVDPTIAINSGFWDKTASERANIMEQAAHEGGVGSFWDLSPDERAEAYERAAII